MLEAKVKELSGKWAPKWCNQISCQLLRKLSTEIANAADAFRLNFIVTAVGTLVSHGGAHT